MPRRTASSPAVLRNAPDLCLERVAEAPEFDLRSLWAATFGTPPPADLSATLLRQALAWRAQERDQGGLARDAAMRLHDLRRGLARDPSYRLNPIGDLIPGTVLARTWKGERQVVYVMEDAFAWQGRTYRSLTAVAHAITGGAWPGPSFFGLYKSPRRRAADGAPS